MLNSLQVAIQALPFILEGALVTVSAVAIALFCGLLLGLPMAIIQVYGSQYSRSLVNFYVWIFRGIPILVLLFLFYGIAVACGLSPNAFFISCWTMACISAAYQSQIFRGALQSLPKGQFKAAQALAMTKFQAMRYIIIPQAMRLAIPGWANEFSILLKDSAVCYVLGTQEIMARTSAIAARTHEHLILYTTAGILYFILTVATLYLLNRLEKKLQIPGYHY